MKGVIMNSQQNGTININEFTLDEKPKKLSKSVVMA
jgi:hypothetical protein